MEIDIANEQVPEGVAVRVRVRLSGRETSRLFLSGDTLIQLPLDGALSADEDSPIPRTSVFLSELVGLADGLSRVFSSAAAADAYAGVVRGQLDATLEAL
ncbi:MAG: hypothetical protein WCP98_00985 [Actinomycetes bacterium]